MWLKHNNGKPTCFECGESFERKRQLNEHMQRHTGVMDYTCPFCGTGCTNPFRFSVHLVSHTDERPYQCSMCSSTFKHLRYVYIHERSVHYKSNRKGTRQHMERTFLSCKCDLCGRDFRTTNALTIHRRTVHEGKKGFVCKVCGKEFASATGMYSHFKLNHGADQCNNRCPHCPKVFVVPSLLVKHLNKKHSITTEYECQSSSQQLAKHVRKEHRKEQLPILPCNQCGAIFNLKTHLKKHQATHEQLISLG